MAKNNYATEYQGQTYDYGDWHMAEKVLCFLVGSFVFGVLWLMFKPVDVIGRLRGRDAQ